MLKDETTKSFITNYIFFLIIMIDILASSLVFFMLIFVY